MEKLVMLKSFSVKDYSVAMYKNGDKYFFLINNEFASAQMKSYSKVDSWYEKQIRRALKECV